MAPRTEFNADDITDKARRDILRLLEAVSVSRPSHSYALLTQTS